MNLNNRIYVPAASVAQACGLSLLDLENRYRPDSWGSPRDFTALHAGLFYAEASLPALADALLSAGQIDAALRLREWIFRELSAGRRFGESPTLGEPVPVAREELTPAIGAGMARARRHASDTESSPFRDEEL